MKLNRRNFIKLLAGAVAGIHATPLPWKLTDDIAIWTQNWPWLPVPEKGEFNYQKSVCTLCPGGCGIEVRRVDARPIKIDGRSDYPINPGGICPMGAGGLQLLYNEQIRFTSPMKRMGPKGSGKFLSISWEEGLEAVIRKIVDLRKEGRPESVVIIDGFHRYSTMSLLLKRFADAIGTPNYLRIPDSWDTQIIANYLMMGYDGPFGYDLENSDLILSFGCGFIEGWGSPGRSFNAWRVFKQNLNGKNTRFIQIEARASNTASKADLWIAPRPGTESALALGIAHVIVKEGLYNRDFLEKNTWGFNDFYDERGEKREGFRSILRKYDPKRAEEITGVKASLIRDIAVAFSKAKSPLAICGKGKGDLNGLVWDHMAILALNVLVGGINREGGIILHDELAYNPWQEVIKDKVSEIGVKKSRIDGVGKKEFPFSRYNPWEFADKICSYRKSPAEIVLIFSSNPVFTLLENRRFKRAIEKIPLVVNFTPFRDETSYYSDIVLPDCVYLEKMEDIANPPGIPYPLYAVSPPVLDPLYDTRNCGDILIQLAKGIGGTVSESFPWEGFNDCIKERLSKIIKGVNGIIGFEGSKEIWKGFGAKYIKSNYLRIDDAWEKIQSAHIWFRPTYRKDISSFLNTPSGRLEFFSQILYRSIKEGGISVSDPIRGSLPHFDPELSNNEKGLKMIPYELIQLSSNWLPSPPYIYKILFDHQLLKGDSFVEINPQTAKIYGLQEGDKIILKSKSGSIKVRVHLFEGAMPDRIFIPLGFGHFAYDDFQKDKGVNPNDIMECKMDPISGYPIWWTTEIEIEKI